MGHDAIGGCAVNGAKLPWPDIVNGEAGEGQVFFLDAAELESDSPVTAVERPIN